MQPPSLPTTCRPALETGRFRGARRIVTPVSDFKGCDLQAARYLPRMPSERAIVTAKGARRWSGGHPWIFRSDVEQRPDAPPGAVLVEDRRGRALGWALWSPESEISLRLLDSDPAARIDGAWWHRRLERAWARRAGLERDANAYRLVHGEGDGCPSLVCDRY